MIRFEKIGKNYGKKKALTNFSLDLHPNSFYGLIGPNGSGKTTLMKIMAGLHQVDEGDFSINGEPFHYKMKDQIAFMPAEDMYYPWLSLKDIQYTYEKSYTSYDPEILAKFCGERKISLKQKVSNLSTGEKAIVRVLTTLAHKAQCYIFDEPLNGIDILARNEILDFIGQYKNEDTTILVSSHIISELETKMDHALFLKEGQLIHNNSMKDLSAGGRDIEDIYKEFYEYVTIN